METLTKQKDVITTARLPQELRSKLDYLAARKNVTKSQIIIEALEMYYQQEDEEPIDSYKLGLPFFGKYNLGPGDLSVTYKERLKEIIRKKHLARSGSN